MRRAKHRDSLKMPHGRRGPLVCVNTVALTRMAAGASLEEAVTDRGEAAMSTAEEATAGARAMAERAPEREAAALGARRARLGRGTGAKAATEATMQARQAKRGELFIFRQTKSKTVHTKKKSQNILVCSKS